MAGEPILVDGESFLGRQEEQAVFRQALRSVLSGGRRKAAPFVIVVQGEAGSGKSKLLRCLRDIAVSEAPFDAEVQTILADWGLERDRHVRLKVASNRILPETIYNHLYRMARDAGWGHHFNDYQSAVRRQNEIEGKVAESLEQTTWDHRVSALQFLEANGIAALIRMENGRALEDGWREGGFQKELQQIKGPQLKVARELVLDWLHDDAGLKPEEERIFSAPRLGLAQALGVGFAKVSQTKPLVLLQDSFEVVAHHAHWFRALIQAAGDRVIWVFAGEEGLETALGLAPTADEPSLRSDGLVLFDLGDLGQQEIEAYFRSRSPDRLLTEGDVEALFTTTQGIPIIVQMAADLWAGGVPLEEIVQGFDKEFSREGLIDQMSQRLLLHSGDPEDRRSFLMMVIQRRPDEAIQTAVMKPEKGTFDYTDFIHRLKSRYFSISISSGVYLHERIAGSLRQYLLRHRIRFTDELKEITRRATTEINKRRDRLEAGFPRLEDRFESDEWREVMLDSDHWMFWHNEFTAWRQFNRDFVDSMGYDPDLTSILIRIAEQVEPMLGRDGRQRLRVIKQGMPPGYDDDADRDGREARQPSESAELAMFNELERWLGRYGSKDVYALERRAVLDLRKGQSYARRKRNEEALNLLLQVEKNLPSRGEALVSQLGLAFEQVGELLAWQRRDLQILNAAPSVDAERSLKKALAHGRRKAKVYHALGAVQVRLGRFEASLENLLQAVTLNPGNMGAWKHLGDVYFEHKQFEKAVPAYRRAIELEPRLMRAHLALAASMRELGQDAEFAELIGRLKPQIEQENEYVRACFEAIRGEIGPAISLLKAALDLQLATPEQVRRESFFEPLRNHPTYQQIISL